MLKATFVLACSLVATGQDPAKFTSAPKAPAFQAPKEWRAIGPGPLISAAFRIEKGERIATVTVTGLRGGGSLAANVNRWRAQVGLEAAPEKEALQGLKATRVDGGAGHFLDLAGPGLEQKGPQRMQVVIATRGELIWYFKIMGPPNLVGEQSAAFDGFIKSVRFEK
jgi:hypothetical protein